MIEALGNLPDKQLHDAGEISIAFQESIIREESKMDEQPSTKAHKSDSAGAVMKAMKSIDLPGDRKDMVEQAKNQGVEGI